MVAHQLIELRHALAALRHLLFLGKGQPWFAVRKAQGTKMALGEAATVQLTGFWLALARGRSRSCPLMVARADARSAGHGRTTHSTKLVLVCRGGASRKVRHTPPKRRVPHGDTKKSKKKQKNGASAN